MNKYIVKEAITVPEQNPNMWETIVALMDNDIREQVHAELAPCTEEEFYNRYCELHEQKYGIAFIIN